MGLGVTQNLQGQLVNFKKGEHDKRRRLKTLIVRVAAPPSVSIETRLNKMSRIFAFCDASFSTSAYIIKFIIIILLMLLCKSA